MFPVLFLALTPQPTADTRPPVALAEAERFGVAEYQVRFQRDLAWRQEGQLQDEVASPWNNTADVVKGWRAECRWRFLCWDLLDDVVGCPTLDADHKLRSLTRLRDELGDDDFYAGRMPDPLCRYKVPEWQPPSDPRGSVKRSR